MQDTSNFQPLHEIRVEISEGLFEIQILLQKIYEYEENREVVTLAEIGKRICKTGRENCEKLEFAIEKIKNGLQ